MRIRQRSQTAAPMVQRRIAILLTVVLFVVIALAGRIAWVQFVDGKDMVMRVRNQLMDNKVLQSPRGTIYDRNGRELALSSLTKSLYADPAQIKPDKETVAGLLAPVLGMNADTLSERMGLEGHFVWLKRMLDPEVSQKVIEIIKAHDLKGLNFIEESKRFYPNDGLAAHILGFVGTDDVGLEGLELVLDKDIKGTLSEQAIETDSRGIPIFQSIFNFLPRKEGKNVQLTIDSTIQFIVEQSLDKVMANSHASAATAIVMNPRTGEILAMANKPGYNPNHFEMFSEKQWKNRAVSIVYEPGSTFKSIVAAAALQEGLVTPEERFSDTGFVEVSGRRIQNWSGESYGNISFTDIIKNSINTGFVQIGMRVGAVKLNDYVRNFGFGKPTGIELPGEEQGILFDPHNMRDSDLATMSIGQSIAVTPLQLITAVSAIANDGVLLKPKIIKEVLNADGSVFSASPTEVVRQVIRSDTAHTLVGLMEKVVSEGGGKKAAVAGYRFAGKTGTAEKLNEHGGGYETGHYIASFIGFGPVEDPQITVLIVIDDPDGMYYGGEIAAPVFSEIASQIMRYLNIPPSVNTIPAAPQATANPPVQSMPSVTPSAGQILVPNLVGRTVREAADILHQAGLAMFPVGTGVAVSQSIPPHTAVAADSQVTVYFESR
ncbi:putative membrane protein [Propionispora sp. 2/2-37]|uniref:penicillin-binding protein n=1 Tax=Propionispora sp. 2/2-37 TaxID=1677858 RepID=UPI0006BB9838|nr:penicillin-binding transpeptidase domain-containing protein [Propionispora sp. 2/2-37]CUH97578.1 putative membrane protein [Propionispora sp. 2/2-37]